MRAFLMGIVLTLFSTAVLADTALVIGDYNNAPDSVAARLEAAGHTVTIQRDTNNPPADISGYDQIWDLRWYHAFDQTVTDQYDDFVKNGGFLFISTENPGCCNTQNATKAALITQMGGGDTTIGGTAGSTENTVVDGTNTTYMTSGLTVNFSAISAIENDQGTALITDGSGKVAAMMWVGNAGDLGTDYTGTVITIADINWIAQGFTNVDQVEDNTQALDDIINGVVAGTVAGTISEEGNGAGSDIGGEPAAPTLVSSEDGDPIIVTTDTAGGTTTVTVESFAASETDTQQTLVKETDTIVTTVTNRETCTTPTTVNTYSDSTTETVNGTESCTTEEISSSTTTTATDTYVGAIDQQATAQDIVNTQIRNLDFSGLQGVKQSHTYENGMSGDTTGFTLGGTLPITDNGLIIGGGFAQLNTTMDGANTSSSETTAFQGSVARAVGGGTGELKVTRAMTDYSWTREIGPYSNAGSSSVTDTSISGTYRHALNENITPIVGYTIGRRESDAWQETGFLFSQRSAEASEETYRYGTVGVEAEFEMLNLNAVRHTDGVTVVGAGLGSSTEKFDWGVGVERTITDLGESTGVKAGIKIRF
jgi:hypothetical protein